MSPIPPRAGGPPIPVGVLRKGVFHVSEGPACMTVTRSRPQTGAAGAPFYAPLGPGRRAELRQKRIAASDREGKSVREPAAATPALRLDAPAPRVSRCAG